MRKEIRFSELCNFTDKQKEAQKLIKQYDYLLYGGAMGGGKSYWLRWELIDLLTDWAAQGIKGVRVGLFCEDYPALRDRHLSKIQYEFPDWLGSLNKADYEYTLSPEYGSGVICFRNLDDPSKYKSSEFAAIAVDEITQNEKEVFEFLRTRKRWPGIERTKFIAGTNPGGKGHEWVKKIWMEHKFEANEKEQDQFSFLQSRAFDNPHLAQTYFLSLEGLPEAKRKAYLDGDWNTFEGQYFGEFEERYHVCEPFAIPDTWFKYRSIDPSGREGVTSCHWYAVDSNGRVYVYKEYYSTGRDIDEHAKAIKRLSQDKDGIAEEYRYTIIDSAAFAKAGYSETTAEIYERNGVCGFLAAAKERIIGWNGVHTYFRLDPITKQPMLKIFKNCYNLIRTIPLAQHDQLHPEDVADINNSFTDSEGRSGTEHQDALDELRYFLRTLRETKAPKPMNAVEKHIQDHIKRQNLDFNYRYTR